jgi:hypothetical protein
MPEIDLYRLSKLAFADVTGWRRILKELRRDHTFRFFGYRPFRKAAVRLLRLRDRDNDARVVATMNGEAPDAEWAGRNQNAYNVFKELFADDLVSVDQVYMGTWRTMPDLAFSGDVNLTGGPHFAATDARGQRRYVYLHPSTDWRDKEVDAFCELLCFVTDHRFGAPAPDVWFLDIANGCRVRYRPKVRVLRRCKDAAELLFSMRNLGDL